MTGNDAVRAGRYDDAVRLYSDAVTMDPYNAVYYGNRFVVWLRARPLTCVCAFDNFVLKVFMLRIRHFVYEYRYMGACLLYIACLAVCTAFYSVLLASASEYGRQYPPLQGLWAWLYKYT